MRRITYLAILAVVFLCSCGNQDTKKELTADKAFEGVNNYCHDAYDWSVAEDNPEIMFLEMGEENDTAYQVVFHSYTGSLVYFYVNKENGMTKMVESVPMLGIEEESGVIDVFDYLDKKE